MAADSTLFNYYRPIKIVFQLFGILPFSEIIKVNQISDQVRFLNFYLFISLVLCIYPASYLFINQYSKYITIRLSILWQCFMLITFWLSLSFFNLKVFKLISGISKIENEFKYIFKCDVYKRHSKLHSFLWALIYIFAIYLQIYIIMRHIKLNVDTLQIRLIHTCIMVFSLFNKFLAVPFNFGFFCKELQFCFQTFNEYWKLRLTENMKCNTILESYMDKCRSLYFQLCATVDEFNSCFGHMLFLFFLEIFYTTITQLHYVVYFSSYYSVCVIIYMMSVGYVVTLFAEQLTNEVSMQII